MSRAVFTSDVHLHPYRIGSRDGGLDRLQDGAAVLRATLKLAQVFDCPWVFCGDFKQPKTVWPQDALNAALAAFEMYPRVPKLMIPGNHDGLYGQWGSGLEPFRRAATVVDRPQHLVFHDVPLACWPFGLARRDEYQRWLAALPDGYCLLAHAFVRGVALGPTDVHLPGRGADATTLLGPCRVGVLGDIHKGQWWRPVAGGAAWRWETYGDRETVATIRKGGPWRGELFYPGSPYQQSWGEAGEWPKGALDVELTSGLVRFHPIPSPRFRVVDLREGAAELEALAGGTNFWPDDCVRILLGPRQAGRTVDALVAAVRERSGARSVAVVPWREPPPTRQVAVHAAMTQEELFTRYAEARPLEGEDAAAVVHAGLALAKEED